MTTFLLVHGAWHGGWCYRRVERLLGVNGHAVFAPTLTGLGERSHLFRGDLDLEDHVTDVLQVIHYEELDDIILVGHSYGGMVITVVADRVPDKIRTLVYLDAFVPENGKCQMDYMPADLNAMCRASAGEQGGGITPLPAAALGVNDADVAWVDELCVNHPIGTFEQPATLSAGIDRLSEHKVYIAASTSAAGPFEQFSTAFGKDPSWTTYCVTSGHDIMIDAPQRLAEILEAVAAQEPPPRRERPARP